MNRQTQNTTQPQAVYVDTINDTKNNNNRTNDENAPTRSWVPSEAMENKENWCPDKQIFVGGNRFSSPAEGKKKFGTVRKPLAVLKVTTDPNLTPNCRDESLTANIWAGPLYFFARRLGYGHLSESDYRLGSCGIPFLSVAS